MRTIENTLDSIYIEIRQLESDSNSNNSIKNLFNTRYAQEISIGGTRYTYIRMSITNEVNASILPRAQGILASSSDNANIEAVQMLITAAKRK